ncbi:STN domain-containing protein [Acetobacter indonesiensis]|uniref:STN domain-containing protein n=1 Tax=Acetobacter indonesiensis TaxID=104101 RepID=UPI001F45ED09|nr:STN domain-containing protein [Acetobacter indonesiensis]MCG0995617.1 STN domain-containing protein [Acetobacter indonesiensis]
MPFAVRRACMVTALLTSALLLPAAANAACQHQAVKYDYAPQRLDQAVQDLAHRSGCFVQVDPSLLENKQGAAVHGRYRPLPALTHLLRSTDLKAIKIRDGLAIIRNGPPQP